MGVDPKLSDIKNPHRKIHKLRERIGVLHVFIEQYKDQIDLMHHEITTIELELKLDERH